MKNIFRLKTGKNQTSHHVMKAGFSPQGHFAFIVTRTVSNENNTTKYMIHFQDISNPKSALSMFADLVDVTFLSYGALLTSHPKGIAQVWEFTGDGLQIKSTIIGQTGQRVFASVNDKLLCVDHVGEINAVDWSGGDKRQVSWHHFPENGDPFAGGISSLEDVRLAAFSGDGQIVAQVTPTTISVSSMEIGRDEEYLRINHQTTPLAICMSPDAELLVVVWHDHVTCWQVQSGQDARTDFPAHENDQYVHAVASHDNQHIALLERSGRIVILRTFGDINEPQRLLDFNEFYLSKPKSLSKEASYIQWHPTTNEVMVVWRKGIELIDIGNILTDNNTPSSDVDAMGIDDQTKSDIQDGTRLASPSTTSLQPSVSTSCMPPPSLKRKQPTTPDEPPVTDQSERKVKKQKTIHDDDADRPATLEPTQLPTPPLSPFRLTNSDNDLKRRSSSPAPSPKKYKVESGTQDENPPTWPPPMSSDLQTERKRPASSPTSPPAKRHEYDAQNTSPIPKWETPLPQTSLPTSPLEWNNERKTSPSPSLSPSGSTSEVKKEKANDDDAYSPTLTPAQLPTPPASPPRLTYSNNDESPLIIKHEFDSPPTSPARNNKRETSPLSSPGSTTKRLKYEPVEKATEQLLSSPSFGQEINHAFENRKRQASFSESPRPSKRQGIERTAGDSNTLQPWRL